MDSRKKEKALIIGASGLIGQYARKKFSESYEVIGTYYKNPKEGLIQLDYTNGKKVKEWVEKIEPVIIFNAVNLAGGVDYCELNKVKAKVWHYDSVVNLVDICKEKNIYFIFISTDYIFDGKNGPYTEEDEPNPLNTYGLLKLMAEEYIQKHLNRYLIARTTNVYGWDPESETKNFVMNLIDKLKTGEEIIVPFDQYGNPTFVNNLIDIICELSQIGKNEIYNIAGPEIINRFEWVQIITRIFNFKNTEVKGISTQELYSEVNRPLFSGFILEKIKKISEIPLMSVVEGLKSMNKIFMNSLLL
jgi:dTDP-4-dehydrorhamnose reductase